MIYIYPGSGPDYEQYADVDKEAPIVWLDDADLQKSVLQVIEEAKGSALKEAKAGQGGAFFLFDQMSPDQVLAWKQACQQQNLECEAACMRVEGNENRTLQDLRQEAGEEAAWFAARHRLYELMQKIVPEDLKDAQNADVAFMASAMLQSDEVSLDVMNMAAELLEEMTKGR